MTSRALQIIKVLYGSELRDKKRGRYLSRFLPNKSKRDLSYKQKNKVLDLYHEKARLITKRRIIVPAALIFIIVHVIICIYYYNLLTVQEQDVFMMRAKIDTMLQRRRDLSVNLARMVRDYATHEQFVFNRVSDARSSSIDKPRMTNNDKPRQSSTVSKNNQPKNALEKVLAFLEDSSKGNEVLGGKLPGLLAVAERYPDLRLSDNFQRMMEALIEVEKELSTIRSSYTETVNNFSTATRKFPGNFFAKAYGFEDVQYFQADPDAKSFRPVEY